MAPGTSGSQIWLSSGESTIGLATGRCSGSVPFLLYQTPQALQRVPRPIGPDLRCGVSTALQCRHLLNLLGGLSAEPGSREGTTCTRWGRGNLLPSSSFVGSPAGGSGWMKGILSDHQADGTLRGR